MMNVSVGTRARRWLLGAGLLLAAVLLGAWTLLPGWLRTTAQEQLSAALGRPVTIEAVRINPLSLTVEVDHLQVAGASPQAPPVFAFDRLMVSADLRSILRLAPVVVSAELRAPRLRVTRLAFELNGTRFDTGTTATPFAKERAGELTLTTGRIDLAHWVPRVQLSLGTN
jgi:uncharacterized protein involved in outer membrane biogenesis